MNDGAHVATGEGAAPAAPTGSRMVTIWDPLVRLGHWSLAGAFLVAYLGEGDPMSVHQVAGYAALAIVTVRIVWGFVGPKHARFSDFVTGPVGVWRYLAGLATGKAARRVGHSPAGGAMSVALLLCVLGTAGTGVARLAIEEGEGPLAPILARVDALPSLSFVATAHADDDGDEDERGGGSRGEESLVGEAHEVFANLLLALVLLHLAGVAAGSLVHHENLVAAMITGRKRAE